METGSPSKTFLGVRFVLFGFNPINERKVRSKLVNGGGIDVGQYSQSCSHVIVDKIAYDDPICSAARDDGKTLVTGLWVDHSFDIGMPVDNTSVMYRPPKDLNGIPGAKSLIICLTGYQRQDRDDIMTMVGLMGAEFSKPLVANKVTHLISYKFEGEKYELAKKMKKIKLVNHRWLEDCLKDWELLPESNYNKSGYELEMMDAEAKDSEDEAEDAPMEQSGGRNMKNSALNLKPGISNTDELLRVEAELPEMQPNSSRIKDSSPVIAKSILTSDRVDTHHQSPKITDANALLGDGLQEISFHRNASNVQLPDLCDRTPKSPMLVNDLASTTKSSGGPSSNVKVSGISYSRRSPSTPTLSISRQELSSRVDGSLKQNVGDSKVTDALEPSTERTCSVHFETPHKNGESHNEEGSTSILPLKRVASVSVDSAKSRKIGLNNKASVTGSPLVSCRKQGLEVGSLERNNSFSPSNGGTMEEPAIPNLFASISITKSSCLDKKLTDNVPVPESAISETLHTEIDDEKAPKTCIRGLTESSFPSKPNNNDVGSAKSVSVTGEAENLQDAQQDDELPSLGELKSVTEKSQMALNLDALQKEADMLVAKPTRKKMVARKTLGSRAKSKNTASQKGSIYLSKNPSKDIPATCPDGGNLTAFQENGNEPEISAPTGAVEAMKNMETGFVTEADAVNKNDFGDDETEAPEEVDEQEIEKVHNQEKSEAIELACKTDAKIGKNTKLQRPLNDATARMRSDTMALENNTDRTKLKGSISRRKFGVGEKVLKCDLVKKKLNKGKKQISDEAEVETIPPVENMTESTKDAGEKDTNDGKDTDDKRMEKEKTVLRSTGKTSSTISASKLGNSAKVEKENIPSLCGSQNSCMGEPVNKVVKSTKTPLRNSKKSVKANSKAVPGGKVLNKVSTEPSWFILSGHRLQRKEFQQVIRRLKGRCCRDSHHWLYQATHFITPDLRRTEKLFAAAASGRWVLKSDYLTACNQAGSFLPEEPYEWHKTGLSEDGAISLEAPRKWRLLREKTGHGAFHGMQIIVYGECIAPPLDTLKRVVKAGGGAILATSPPYTRFLESGIDFAIISSGMPRVDLWIQEFVKHEIPCVVADYLVEYVCKPGYSLERHVLYNTHAWAEKSFLNLLRKQEETIEDSYLSPDSISSNGIACEVCGCHNREEVMLICGNESGSIGCGTGAHIDCCDPPLHEVPEEDWFCPKCRESKSCCNPSKKRKKGRSLPKLT